MGGIVYLAGCFLVTIVGNVPLNDALARVDPDAEGASDEWRAYLSAWTRWNHVRTGACVIVGVVIAGGSYA